jgi:hypothetical protein
MGHTGIEWGGEPRGLFVTLKERREISERPDNSLKESPHASRMEGFLLKNLCRTKKCEKCN